MKKILYVTTISNTVNAFLIPHIKMLVDYGHKVDVAFNIEQPVNPEIYELGCKVHSISFRRNPLNISNFLGYKRLRKLIQNEKYDLVHTHTPIASACVRLACRKLKNVNVFYTAHGFHFYKGAPIINWLLYYPIERWLSKYTDVLITINKEDYNRAKHFFKARRIEYVPGVGIDVDNLRKIKVNKNHKLSELGLPHNAFVLLSVGELNENKNHATVIKALAKLNNPQIHYIICGQGVLEDYLKRLVKKLELEKQVHLLGYRKDIPEICKASDVFVFPSFREGLSVALMEAMACGLPIICSNIRGNSDLIENGKGGFLLNPRDIEGFSNAIDLLYSSSKLREELGNQNLKIINKYSIKNVKCLMEKIYCGV